MLLPLPLLSPRLSRKPSATPPVPRVTSTVRKPSVALTPRASRQARLVEPAPAVEVIFTPPSLGHATSTKLSFSQLAAPPAPPGQEGDVSASTTLPTPAGGLGRHCMSLLASGCVPPGGHPANVGIGVALIVADAVIVGVAVEVPAVGVGGPPPACPLKSRALPTTPASNSTAASSATTKRRGPELARRRGGAA